jgi:hypothetical protein
VQDRGVGVEVDERGAGEEAVRDGAGEHVIDEALEVGAELEDVELEEVALAHVNLMLIADHKEDGDLQTGAADRPYAGKEVAREEEEAVDSGGHTVED